MEMVAAAKLRRFQEMMQKAKVYTQGLETLLKRIASSQGEAAQSHPFIQPRPEKRSAVVVMTSDTGLCGSYNNDLVELSRKFIIGKEGPAPLMIGVGKNGISALGRRGFNFLESFTDIRASRIEEILKDLKKHIEDIYISGKVDSVYVIYSSFKTLTSFKATVEKVLPLETPTASGSSKSAAVALDASAASVKAEAKELPYLFEPSPEIIFQRLVPQYFEAKMRSIFLEATVSEQIARMTAMNQATKNAKEMIDTLVLKRNKARQASITKELIEIVSGSQALKLK